jgi:hypothetical protein
MRDVIAFKKASPFQEILFLNFFHALLLGEIRKSCGTRSWSASREPARFHSRHWMIVMRAALIQMQWRQSAFAGLCRRCWYPLYIFARCLRHSPAEIDAEIHWLCEAGRFAR